MTTRRYDSKTKQYFLDWYEDSRRHRIYTGTSQTNADRELEKLKARLLMKKMGFVESSHKDSKSGDNKTIQTIELKTAIQKYLDYSKIHHSPMNYQSTAYFLNGPFTTFMNRKRVIYLSQVTPEIIEDYKVLRLKGEQKIKRIKPVSVNRQINILKPMFKKLTEWHYLEASPLTRVANLKHLQEEKGKCLSKTECQKLLEASKALNGGSFYYLTATALWTGLRKSELKNLKIEDVDLQKREIKVLNRGPEARTKSGKNRIVDLSENICQILSQYVSKNEYFFDFTNFKKNWNKTKENSGVSCRFHDLRHTFITTCLQNGIQPTSIADWVGHSDLRMIMKIYKHLRREHLKEEVNKLHNVYTPNQS